MKLNIKGLILLALIVSSSIVATNSKTTKRGHSKKTRVKVTKIKKGGADDDKNALKKYFKDNNLQIDTASQKLLDSADNISTFGDKVEAYFASNAGLTFEQKAAIALYLAKSNVVDPATKDAQIKCVMKMGKVTMFDKVLFFSKTLINYYRFKRDNPDEVSKSHDSAAHEAFEGLSELVDPIMATFDGCKRRRERKVRRIDVVIGGLIALGTVIAGVALAKLFKWIYQNYRQNKKISKFLSFVTTVMTTIGVIALAAGAVATSPLVITVGVIGISCAIIDKFFDLIVPEEKKQKKMRKVYRIK